MQVVYRPETHPSQSHHPPEFIVLVDANAYNEWKSTAAAAAAAAGGDAAGGSAAVPLVNVLASSKDPVQVLPHGQTGIRHKPSKQELADHCGSEDPFKAAEFILRHGKLNKHAGMKELNKVV